MIEVIFFLKGKPFAARSFDHAILPRTGEVVIFKSVMYHVVEVQWNFLNENVFHVGIFMEVA